MSLLKRAKDSGLFLIPNLLTYFRLISAAACGAVLYLDGEFARNLAFGIFTVAAVTDYFDGLIARLYKQHSKFGQMLDPIADKLLVSTVIFVLIALGEIQGTALLPAIIIIWREMFVSGLREYLAEFNKEIPVGPLAKAKTTIQLIALGYLIVGENLPDMYFNNIITGVGLLWIAAIFTLITGWTYLVGGFSKLMRWDEDQ